MTIRPTHTEIKIVSHKSNHKLRLPAMYRLISNRSLLPKRAFTSTSFLKTDDLKHKLGKLGQAMLKGEVQKEEVATQNDLVQVQSKGDSALERCSQYFKEELEENYLKVIQMSEEDIRIQEHFSQGLQWGGHSPAHFFDRAAAYRSLPDTIDLLNTPRSEIERVYGVISDLDNDKSLFERAIKVASNKVPTPGNRGRQEKNFFESCKNLRRGESPQPQLTRELISRVLFPYDVVGFDRSILGFPLSGVKAISDDGRKFIAQELIEDHNTHAFRTDFPLKKEYVNIIDFDVMKDCVEPQYSKPDSIEEALKIIGKPIFIDDISQYNTLCPPKLPLVAVISTEIKLLERSLASEKEISKGTAKPRIEALEAENEKITLLSLSKDFSVVKSGEFILASKHQDSTIQEGPTYKYLIRTFDIVPFFGVNLVSRKQYHLFYRHLFKVFLTNCATLIDDLTQVKYKLSEDVKTFTRRLYGRIHNIIKNKILPVALKHRSVYSLDFEIIIHKTMRSGAFLRLYWNRKPIMRARKGSGLQTRRQSWKLKPLRIENT